MLLAGAAALAGASLQSATGFGFALLLSPALFAALDPYEAITALLVLGLLLNLLVLADGGLARVRGRLLVPLLIAALPGLVLGIALLEWLPKSTLQMAVGAAVLAAVALQWRRMKTADRAGGAGGHAAAQAIGAGESQSAAPRETGGPASRRGASVPGALVGLSSGALTTSVGLSGPPLLLWLEARGLRPAELRASLAAAFLALNVAGGAAVIAGGGAGSVELGVLAPLVALVVGGHALGTLAFRRLDGARFSEIALALAACAGIASIAAGLAA